MYLWLPNLPILLASYSNRWKWFMSCLQNGKLSIDILTCFVCHNPTCHLTLFKLTLWEPGYDICVLWNYLKSAVVSCLANAIAPLPIALEDCSHPQTDWPVLSALEKIFLVGGCGFFVSDVISEVVLGPFWLMLPDLGPNRSAKVFRWSFHWKLGTSRLSLWSTF